MSGRNRARERKAEREKENRRRQLMVYGMGGVIIGLALLAGFLFTDSGQIEATDRMMLDPYRGHPDAPVTVVEYSAFGCEACEQWHEAGVMDTILEEFPGQVKFVYRDMPIISPAYSQRAAEVAQCALDQGQDAFWTMHDAIFEDATRGSASQNDLIAPGVRQGLDETALRTCAENGTHRETVRYDLQQGRIAHCDLERCLSQT